MLATRRGFALGRRLCFSFPRHPIGAGPRKPEFVLLVGARRYLLKWTFAHSSRPMVRQQNPNCRTWRSVHVRSDFKVNWASTTLSVHILHHNTQKVPPHFGWQYVTGDGL